MVNCISGLYWDTEKCHMIWYYCNNLLAPGKQRVRSSQLSYFYCIEKRQNIIERNSWSQYLVLSVSIERSPKSRHVKSIVTTTALLTPTARNWKFWSINLGYDKKMDIARRQYKRSGGQGGQCHLLGIKTSIVRCRIFVFSNTQSDVLLIDNKSTE